MGSVHSCIVLLSLLTELSQRLTLASDPSESCPFVQSGIIRIQIDHNPPSTPRMSHVVRPPEDVEDPRPTSTSSNMLDQINDPSTNHPTEAAGPSRPPRLTRQSTNNSFHAQNSLRRMATHETGHGIDEDHDGNDRLDTHDEHSENHDHLVPTGPGGDEETRIGAEEISEKKPKAPELQDQTNLLPVRQVILVFLGLTCALFCSLIDQTMYVSHIERSNEARLISSITTALPTLGRVFNRADISPWVGTAYLLTSTVSPNLWNSANM